MKISCPKFSSTNVFTWMAILLVLVVTYLITHNTVSASVTSSTPIADFPQVEGTIYATAVSDDGKTLYIGGDFGYIIDKEGGSVPRQNLASIDLNTLLPTNWNPSPDGTVYDLEIDGDFVLVGGSFYYDYEEDKIPSQFIRIHREDDDLVDTSCPSVINGDDEQFSCWFAPCTIYDIKLTDDFIYLGGSFDHVGSGYEEVITANGLIRLDRNTCALDTTWLPEVDGSVQTIETMGDSVFIGGDFEEVNELERYGFAKISASTGSLDNNCIEDFDGTIYSIKANNNYLYVGGSFSEIYDSATAGYFFRNNLIRLNNDNGCSLDLTWSPNPRYLNYSYHNNAVYSIDFDETDSSIYVGGSFDSIGGQNRSDFAKLDLNTGLADIDWDPQIWTETFTVRSSLITKNYLIVAGSFNKVGAEYRNSLAAFPYETALSPTPTPTPESSISSLDKGKKDHQDKEEVVQIPHAVKKLFGLIVAKPVKDSNTNGQEVLSIIFKDTLDFDAYLSVNHTPVGDLPMLGEQNNQANTSNTAANKGNFLIAGWQGHQLMGFKENKTIYWQIGNIQQMFYKAYPASGKEAAVIIPEVQHKSSIIALKYNKSQLIPPGEPNTKFSELKLKLAHSMDGSNWRVMSNSVVDPINNTVAAIDKLGGYYVIVASY